MTTTTTTGREKEAMTTQIQRGSDVKHTPTPWIQASDHIYAPGKEGGTICAVSEPRATSVVRYTPLEFGSEDFYEAIANAEFITRACNSHDALVSALERAKTRIKALLGQHPVRDIAETFAEIDAALAQAKSSSEVQ